MAMTAGRNTAEILEGRTLTLPVAADTTIFEGSLIALDASGNAAMATKGENLTAAGRAEEYVDNTGGAAGDKMVTVRRGVFKWDNDPATVNRVTKAHVLQNCYMLDDCTVTSLSTGSSVAGKVIGTDPDGGVIVETL